MRSSRVLVVGAIIGAAVVWLWGREIEEFVEEKTRGIRTKTLEGVRAIEENAGKVLDRGGDALHRVDDFLRGHEGAPIAVQGDSRRSAQR